MISEIGENIKSNQTSSEVPKKDTLVNINAMVIPLNYYYKHLRYIEARLNGISCKLLFTTGGGETILSTKLVEKLKSSVVKHVKGPSIGKETQTYGQVNKITIDLPNVNLKQDFALVKDLSSDLPVSHVEIDGIISVKAFKNYILTIDLLNDRLLINNKQISEETLEGYSTDLSYINSNNGVGLSILARLITPEGELWFELDNGKKKNILRYDKSLNILKNSKHFKHIDNHKSYTVESVEVLNFDSDIKTRLPVDIEYETLGDGVLGAQFFMQWRVTLDLPIRKIYLKPNF